MLTNIIKCNTIILGGDKMNKYIIKSLRMTEETKKDLKLYAVKNNLTMGEAIEKLLKIAEEKGEK